MASLQKEIAGQARNDRKQKLFKWNEYSECFIKFTDLILLIF